LGTKSQSTYLKVLNVLLFKFLQLLDEGKQRSLLICRFFLIKP